MKKETFIMTVEYNEEGNDLLERLNITKERAHEIFDLAEKDSNVRGEGSSDKPFDSFVSLMNLMNSGTLTGNEMFMYLLNGYTINIKLNMQRERLMQNPLLGLLGPAGAKLTTSDRSGLLG